MREESKLSVLYEFKVLSLPPNLLKLPPLLYSLNPEPDLIRGNLGEEYRGGQPKRNGWDP